MLRIEPLGSKIGAMVTGIDVNTLTNEDWGRIYQAWLDWNVIVVRDQKLSLGQFLAWSRRFGRLKPHFVCKTRHTEHPEVTLMGVNKRNGSETKAIVKRGEGWHTDSAYDADICKATILYALEIPSIGGDTAFSDMYAAYGALPAPLKTQIDSLACHFAYGAGAPWRVALLEPAEQITVPAAVHPIVRTHPETGRKVLYVNPLDPELRVNPEHTNHIVGMEKADSDVLLSELYSYMLQPGCQYQHQWQVGDIVIWDNRCTWHSALGGYPPHENRVHWRTTVMEVAPSVDHSGE
jgi:taurine dioxygenase